MKVPKICNKNIQLNLPDFSICCLQIWLVPSNCFLQLPLPRKEECWCTREFINVHLQKPSFDQYVGIAGASTGRSGNLSTSGAGLCCQPQFPEQECCTAFPALVLAICTMIQVPCDILGACVCVFSLGGREADCS